ncbi:nitrous oxide reductase family maturation protein NosD [Paenibacillaceae bacterium WGS1546]|uniref:right-handed parallel beta-helix repeat-containing protein n=1 Tax=Cohnella sp. WGS1546 TaxID=3366810 RepID=UPI00372D1389
MNPIVRYGKRLAAWTAIAAIAAACSLGAADVRAEITAAPADAIPLQPILDAAEPGSVVALEARDYAGPATIGKRLTLRGVPGTTVHDGGGDAVVDIRANGVAVERLSIVQTRTGEASAVRVSAADAKLAGLELETRSYGILVRDANRAEIRDNRIAWTGGGGAKSGSGRTSNGIDLFASHDAVIERNTVYDMLDGIYLENSNGAAVADNRVYRSRYGIHGMYTNGMRIVGNHGESNVTGAMVMGVRDAVVAGNSFRKQSESVHSQGLLLFDVHDSRIEGNLVEGNRVGIYVELSSGNRLADNAVERNFVGVQLIESSDNLFSGNRFVANVIEAEATDSAGNRLEANYWDSAQGLDLDGDGFSDLSYPINPFYSRLVERTPSFQLFFQSPGMTFLSGLFAAEADDWARDAAPLMDMPRNAGTERPASGTRNAAAGLIGLALLGGSLFIIRKGVQRT